ncbi:NADPH-dependent oxidoreductase [Micromonospora acroterricola]|uniref:NADPH-dependent oxidoreductase n=1 Tax=Micromonospora acroterricola TaxID=2202421 RepID=A0A317CRE7_9ACTN|nr:NAD(P)H-dependent oxidoreductase [Micromonospora acroterricola]PWR04927.1 NADPH-dependent oxidoreductase [Micromonospora acroterricola]
MVKLRALVLNCTLKPSPAPSSSDQLGREVLAELGRQGVDGELVRVVDHDVRFGVSTDEGGGDGWPAIRAKLLPAQILILATPIWLGQPSSVCKMVLERLDAELSETDAEGRLLTYGKVAGVAVVGNEDGAHHTIGQVQQALNEVGFTCPAAGATYWVGEALHKVDYRDAGPKTDTTGRTTTALALNSAHLARLLADRPYPPPDAQGAAVGPSREPA